MSTVKGDKKMSERWEGWTNRETWATFMGLLNDDELYEDTHQMKKNANNEEDLADAIRENIINLEDMVRNGKGNQMLKDMIYDIGNV